MFQRLPLLVMPRPFRALHISLRVRQEAHRLNAPDGCSRMTRSCEGEGAYLMFRGTWHSNSGSMMIATAVVMLLASCTSSGDNKQLPPYAHRESGGAVRIDIEEAGRGLAILEHTSDSPTISKRIILSHEEDALAFGFAVISGPSTIRGTFLEDPPLRVSPRITPGDGVADFFAAVWIDDKTDELHYDLFMDTDWQDLIEGDLAIHTQAIVDGKLQLSREPIDYSEAIGAVYHKELVFTHVLQNIRTLGPVVGVTNVPGDTEEFLRTLSTLDLEPEHVAVSFSGDGCAEGILPKSGLGVGIGYGSSTLSKEKC